MHTYAVSYFQIAAAPPLSPTLCSPRLLLKKQQLFGLSREYILELIEFIGSRGKKPFGWLTFEEVEGMMHGKL